MKKEKYERAQTEVIRFTAEDIIMTTGEIPDSEYELDNALVRSPIHLIGR